MDEASPREQSRAQPEVTFSVVVPVFNSAAIVSSLHGRLVAVFEELGEPFELIFVEDAGTDGSWAELASLAERDRRTTAIQLMKNSGQGSATVCGLSRAHGAFIITIDDDLQHPPEEIPRLVDRLTSDPELDVVLGVPREKQHAPGRRVGSWIVDRMNTLMLGKPAGLRYSGFRVMRAGVAAEVSSQRVHQPALGPVLTSITGRIANVEVEHHRRAQGHSGYTPVRLLRQTMSNAIGYSMLPLRLLAGVGMIGIVGSLALAAVFLIRFLTGGTAVPGFTTQALLITALFGFNFFAFGVLGEYVLRILQLSSARPTFTVRHEVRPPPT